MGNGMMDGAGSMFSGGMFFGPTLMIGVVLLAVLGIAWMFKGGNTSRQSAQSAKQVLDTRLAAGEINSTEYADLKRQITA